MSSYIIYSREEKSKGGLIIASKTGGCAAGDRAEGWAQWEWEWGGRLNQRKLNLSKINSVSPPCSTFLSFPTSQIHFTPPPTSLCL